MRIEIMKQDKFLTVREVAEDLGITEQEVINLAEEGKIPAYKIAGVYLRFKSEHIQEARQRLPGSDQKRIKIGFFERLRDILYFTDFYILTLITIILLLLVIFRT